MEIIEKGKGPVFTDPDPDAARAFFQKKSRIKKDKTMSLKQAVETFVNDGDYLGIGGFGANRTPVAACHEIVRQKKRNLGFAGHTATHDMQILSAGKVYDRIDVAYVVGLEARGLSACSRKYLESGDVQVSEWSNYALSVRLQAAAMGVPFLPMRSMLGTQTFEYSGAVSANCPFTGKKMALVPALSPDVSFIHVHEADIYGNARFEGIAVADIELANASKHLIITCERIVPHEEIARDPHKTQIPYFIVDAVCEVPYGAYPGTMPNEYFSDEDHIKEWMAKEKDAEAFEAFLEENIYGCENFAAYLDRNGGMEKMQQLRRKEFMINGEGE
ncbi:MAG: CoA transferase subunit A [Desulfobacterales bacterium]|nr:CoA transferase subunit A [Desulfobacterales bacterium]